MSDPYAEILDEYGQLRDEHVEDLLVEVVSGRHIFESGGRVYASRNPTPAEQDRGRLLYARRLRECRLRGIPDRSAMRNVAVSAGALLQEDLDRQAAIERMIERLTDGRAKTTSVSQKRQIDEDVERLRQELMELRMDEAAIMAWSAESVAEHSREAWYICCGTLSGDLLDEPVWPDLNARAACADQGLLEDSRLAFERIHAGLPSTIIRALARTSAWRLRWQATRSSGTTPFEGHSGCWDANKIALVHWSEFYDTIYKHPDCPADAIVNDDHAIQEWLNQQMGKSKRPKQTASSSPVPTYVDGRGQRHQMTRIGSATMNVNAPYRIRTGTEETP